MAAVVAAELAKCSGRSLTYHAAHVLVTLTLNLFKAGKTVVSNSDMNAALFSIADNLYTPAKSSVLDHCSASLEAFIKAQNLDAEWIKATKSKFFKHHLLADHPSAAKYLTDQSEDLVFNYKNKQSEKDLHFLLKFYRGLTQQAF